MKMMRWCIFDSLRRVIPEEEIPDDPDEDADAANHAFFARLFRFSPEPPIRGRPMAITSRTRPMTRLTTSIRA